MESKILNVALGQGIFAVLFVFLFFYMLKENSKRENNYQKIIENLSNKFEHIEDGIKELNTKFIDWLRK